MSDVLDRIRHELHQRLEATRAAAQEHERVRAALDALEGAAKQVTREAGKRGRGLARARPSGGNDGSATTGAGAKSPSRGPRAGAPSRSPTRSPKSGAKRRAPRKTTRASSTQKAATGAPQTRPRAGTPGTPSRARAPRGANREAVLAVVRDRPGVTASELAAASGVTGGTLSALLRRLTTAGELEKRDLPSGQTGYAVGGAGTNASAAAEQGRVTPADGGPDTSRAAERQAKPPAEG